MAQKNIAQAVRTCDAPADMKLGFAILLQARSDMLFEDDLRLAIDALLFFCDPEVTREYIGLLPATLTLIDFIKAECIDMTQ